MAVHQATATQCQWKQPSQFSRLRTTFRLAEFCDSIQFDPEDSKQALIYLIKPAFLFYPASGATLKNRGMGREHRSDALCPADIIPISRNAATSD